MRTPEENVGRVQTPAYIFDEAAFAERTRACRRILGEETGLCFSMKANPFLLRALPHEIDRVEVCSPGELELCERAGVDMGRVLYSGVNKGQEDIIRAIRAGVAAVTAESLHQFQLICRGAAACKRKVPVLLRLTDGSQFGMDEEDLRRIIREWEGHPEVKLAGIHYFTGTQKRRTATVIRQLEMLEELLKGLQQDYGFEAECLEYGPGLDVEYFKASSKEGTRAADAGKAEEAMELDRLKEIVPALHRLCGKTKVTVEMGRLLAAPCGIYLSAVSDTKINRGVRYAILDGGAHQMKYDGQLQGMQLPRMAVLRRESKGGACRLVESTETESWTLYGSLCSTADVFARNAPLPPLHPGDVIVFFHTGAYSMCEGISLFLSRDLPQIWSLPEKGEPVLLRERMEVWPFNAVPGLRSV